MKQLLQRVLILLPPEVLFHKELSDPIEAVTSNRRGKDPAQLIGVFRGVVIFELETALGDCMKMVIARLHGRLSLAYAHGRRRSRCISTAFTAMPVPMPRTQ